MKTALKITFGTMLAVSLINTAYANEQDIWQQSAIHVNGTWTRATENGLSFGDFFSPSANSDFGTRRAAFVHPNTDFDWGIGYTYHVPCTHTRLFFHYDNFNDGHHTNAAPDLINITFPQGYSVGTVHDRLDEFTFGIDRRIAFGACYVVDTAFFLEWDKLHRSFYENTFTNSEGATRDTYNRFKGFGPGVGIKGRGTPFRCPNVGVFATFSSTLLYGKNRFHSLLNVNEELSYELDPEETRSLVNKFDISFGVDYKGVFQLDCDQIQLGVSLGLRYLNYINVFKNGNTFYNPHAPERLANGLGEISNTGILNTGFPEDWGRFGPFLQFRIGGADA